MSRKHRNSIISTLALVLVLLSAQSFAVGEANSPLGLYVQDGVLKYQGQPYRAMGINYNNCFGPLLKDPENREFVKGFQILKEVYQIPYIRFRAGPFYHDGWELYDKDPQEYFQRMDLLVIEAEKRELGLIPSLFWYVVAVPDYCNEPLKALGIRSSKSRKFIAKYTTEMVNRYKDSPAIYGWELGNEYMLYADLPKYDHLPAPKKGSDKPRTKADKLLRPMLISLYTDFYKTIRRLDRDRIIVTGDSVPRAFAWHNRNEDSWGKDTKQQWLSRFRLDTPRYYEVVSFHLYKQADDNYFEDVDISIEQLVGLMVETCREDKKVIWCGELGMPGTDEESKAFFYRMMKIIEDNEIELSAIWNFVPEGKFQPDWDILSDNERAYMLKAVKELNERFAIGKWK